MEAFFLFQCNYDVKDIPITSQFYSELLKWWSDFREEFDTERDQQNIVWNNKEIRINNKPVFYKNEQDEQCVNKTQRKFNAG